MPQRASAGERRERAKGSPAPDTLTPADRYQELFVAVQQARVFDDSKTFVDCAPLGNPADILAAYRTESKATGFDLTRFVDTHFQCLRPAPAEYEPVVGQPLREHIASLWPVLTRHPKAHPPASSLLQLPHPYVVPGGRFAELYYWDSYFTMLGLAADGQLQRLGDMIENFAYLIDTYGHVPNGTRSYYLGRSQPPVFALMVALGQAHRVCEACDFLPQLLQEHAWWMRGAEGLAVGEACHRVVRVAGPGLAEPVLLNRYWDDRNTPREEAWLEDVTTALAADRDAAQVHRHLRAACESGWDFSTRWLREPPAGTSSHAAPTAASLASICTTDLLPVDLNAFLYGLEQQIATLSRQAGDAATARTFEARAAARAAAMQALMWSDEEAAFFDHDWRRGERRRALTAACVTPLFVGLGDDRQAAALARTVEQRLLAPGGFSTTEWRSDQQWDRPNGWAPLQWIAAEGLRRHGQARLADLIASRWLCTVAALYEREGRLVEKYALRTVEHEATHGGGGGEYRLQDGFGWTNGVTAAFLARYPGHTAHGARAHVTGTAHR